MCAGDYAENLVQGFQSAYGTALEDVHVNTLLSEFFYEKSRAVLRHTQQYVMYQIVSLHPDYMESKEKRKNLLSVIYKEGESKLQKDIHDYEISSLVQMDIPYFEMKGDSCALYDGNGKKYDGYFPCSPYTAWRKHVEQINSQDMIRQTDFIRLSMALLNNGKRIQRKADLQTSLSSAVPTKIRIMELVKIIVMRICDSAVIAGNDINWAGLQFWETDRWSMEPSGMYLYSGISGIVLFLGAYLQNFKDKKTEKIFYMAKAKIQRYTEQLSLQGKRDHTLATGLFDGESSIVYTYLLLHKITGEASYLKYAEKHFCAMELFLHKDKHYDYLSGNAGAIKAAVMLYDATAKEKYCTLAVQLEEQLWKQRQDMEYGCGWRLENMGSPLAGMAHGNSGYLMAYADLYEVTGDRQYQEKMNLLLEYENSLYSEKLGNWLDLRQQDGETHTMNAWCHGAPGILLARLRVEQMMESDLVAEDIRRASQALFTKLQDGQICLCHGIAGNLLIMQQYLHIYNNREFSSCYEQKLKMLLSMLENMDKLSPIESLNPAFMNGISGVGFALIELYKGNDTPQ